MLSFIDSSLTKTLQYKEDDPPLPLVIDLNLRDVDSNLTAATLQFTGLLNGDNDYFNISQSLASMYGLNITTNNQPTSRTITITGSASPEQYSEVSRERLIIPYISEWLLKFNKKLVLAFYHFINFFMYMYLSHIN